mgnify:CR=1 FL=1
MQRLTLRAGVLSAVLAAATGLTGCSNFRDLFSAHADVAAEAAGMELPAERLANILAGAGGRQKLTREAAEFIAAQLTSVMDNTEDVARYVLECARLGIEVEVAASLKLASALGRWFDEISWFSLV